MVFFSHYQQVESGTHGDEDQGGAAEDSQGTKESDDEKGSDLKRQRSGSNKDKKGVRRVRVERVREGGREEEKRKRRERESTYAHMLSMYHCFMFPQFFSPRVGILNIFSASHRNKNAELHKIFTSLPASEKLIDGEGI
jgi:hypothetical protein